jgi:myo-inositol-1(or 4)-monophosphatase
MNARAELLDLAASAAKAAGQMVRDGRRRGIADVTTKSSATDMVTEFDKASERYIVGRILEARPHDGIVGEEGTDTEGSSGVRWLIDPIDGTTNFLYGLAGYAVSVAAADERGALVGAVYVPSTDELFAAGRGDGATCNGVAIAPSSTRVLSSALVGTGFSYLAERRLLQAARVASLIGEIRDIRRFGAAAADLCYVAAGRLDVYYEEHLAPWDLAAGDLIAREAGCRTGDFGGGPVRPAQVLVSTPALFDSMVNLLSRPVAP